MSLAAIGLVAIRSSKGRSGQVSSWFTTLTFEQTDRHSIMLGEAHIIGTFYFRGANEDSLTSFPSRANTLSCKRQHTTPIAQLNSQTGDRCCQSTCEGEFLFPEQQALGFPRTEEIDQGGGNDRESTSEDNSDTVDLPPKKKYRRPTSNSEIAEQLTQQICWGLERMASRTRAFDPFKVEKKYFVDQFEEIEAMHRDIFPKIGEIQARNSQRGCGAAEDLEELDKLLEKGELKAITNQKEAKDCDYSIRTCNC
jgi:hypothetical protein